MQLRRHQFMTVVYNLAPHDNVGAFSIKNNQLSIFYVVTYHVFRQKRDSPVLQQKAGNDIGIAHFPEGMQFIALRRKKLFHGIPVADALLREIKRFLQEPLYGNLFLSGQWRIRRRHKIYIFRLFRDLDPFGKIHFLVKKVKNVDIILTEHAEKIRHQCGIGTDFHMRADFLQLHDYMGKDADDIGFAGTDADLSGNVSGLPDNIFCLTDGFQYIQCMRKKPFSCLCQFYLSADSFKQLRVQFLFQLFEVPFLSEESQGGICR